MKKAEFTFLVPDFCPDSCKAFDPFKGRDERLVCLRERQCQELYAMLKKHERAADAPVKENREAL